MKTFIELPFVKGVARIINPATALSNGNSTFWWVDDSLGSDFWSLTFE